MYDEGVKARFEAYCRAHPAWVVARFLEALGDATDLGERAPVRTAWRIVLARYAREIEPGAGAPAADAVAGPGGGRAGD